MQMNALSLGFNLAFKKASFFLSGDLSGHFSGIQEGFLGRLGILRDMESRPCARHLVAKLIAISPRRSPAMTNFCWLGQLRRKWTLFGPFEGEFLRKIQRHRLIFLYIFVIFQFKQPPKWKKILKMDSPKFIFHVIVQAMNELLQQF